MFAFPRRVAARTWRAWTTALPFHLALSAGTVALMGASMGAIEDMHAAGTAHQGTAFVLMGGALLGLTSAWVLAGLSVRPDFTRRTPLRHIGGLVVLAGALLLFGSALMGGFLLRQAQNSAAPSVGTGLAITIGIVAFVFFGALDRARRMGDAPRAAPLVAAGPYRVVRTAAALLWADVAGAWARVRFVWARMPGALAGLVVALIGISAALYLLGLIAAPLLSPVPALAWLALIAVGPAWALCPTAAAAVFADSGPPGAGMPEGGDTAQTGP